MSQEFNGNAAPSAITLLPSILDKIPILLFAGDQDFICNYMGIESMIQAMTWGGAKGLGVSLLVICCWILIEWLLTGMRLRTLDCED